MSAATTEQLLEDLKQVIHDAEELLRATAGQAGEHIAQARASAEASLLKAKTQLSAMAHTATGAARNAAEHTDRYVHSNPWPAIGAGVVAGLLAGLLIGRRGGRQ